MAFPQTATWQIHIAEPVLSLVRMGKITCSVYSHGSFGCSECEGDCPWRDQIVTVKLKYAAAFCCTCLSPFLSLFYFVPFTQDPSSLPLSFCVYVLLSPDLVHFVYFLSWYKLKWHSCCLQADLHDYLFQISANSALCKNPYQCDLLCYWKD